MLIQQLQRPQVRVIFFNTMGAIITGGSEGIGFETARLLAANGATVLICARREEKLRAAKDEIAKNGGKVEKSWQRKQKKPQSILKVLVTK